MGPKDSTSSTLPKNANSLNPAKYLCGVCGAYHLYNTFEKDSKEPVISPAKKPVSRRKLPARICRSSRISLKVAPQELKAENITTTTVNRTVLRGKGKLIVDFVRFSHDVTLFRVGFPIGGTLKIKDRNFKTLRVATSSTGDFLLGQPLDIEAGKFYRMHLISRADITLIHYRGSSWKTNLGDVTAEWGSCTIDAGVDLWIYW